MFKIRTNRTMPQALTFMAFIMMFMVMGITIVLFTITPQYVQYGNQKYVKVVQDHSTNTTITKHEIKRCSTEAPAGTNNNVLYIFYGLNSVFFTHTCIDIR